MVRAAAENVKERERERSSRRNQQLCLLLAKRKRPPSSPLSLARSSFPQQQDTNKEVPESADAHYHKARGSKCHHHYGHIKICNLNMQLHADDDDR